MPIVPKKLRPGNKVAIVAPSSPFNPIELQEGLDIISSMGLIPVLGPNVKNLHVKTIHAASVISRVDELMWAFTAKDISAVICAVGGFGCAELLPYLDYETIARSKRVFITKSDGSALNNGILNCANLINFNARTPSIRLDKGHSFAQANCESLMHTIRLLMSDKPWGSSPFSINNVLTRCINPGVATGIAIGGNLDTFSRLLATEYIPSPKGAILFIEDVHKSATSIARSLLQLKLSGYTSNLNGIVVGEFSEIPTKKAEHEPSIEDILLEYLGDKIPIVYGLSFSHGPYTCPIPIGSMTTVDASNRTVSFDYCMG